MTKQRPYDKTVVAEVKISLADRQKRTMVMQLSQAGTVPTDSQFNSGVINVDSTEPLYVRDVKTCVCLKAGAPFLIDYRTQGQEVSGLRCDGVFIFFGQLDQLLASPVDATPVRIDFIYA